MIIFTGALLAAFLSAPAAERPLALLDVPFISQSESLCGGAAAAMVLRYWGASGVTAEDFAPLVDESAGGIETAVLARAVQERGWAALPAAGTAALVQAELRRGRPVIALVEDRPGAFHYVVLVGWHERAVVLHDPARTPYVLLRPDEFARRWKASGNWMLAVVPPAAVGSDREPASTPLTVHPRDRCEALVAEGVALARENDLAGAERVLADAAYGCPGAAPLRELAGVRLLQRRWPEVRELAARAVAFDAADTHAWRLLGAARFVGGDHGGALDAWNRAGEPVIDLVSVSGLERTTHRSVERLLALRGGAILTDGALARARRRLEELPAAFSTRLEYIPRAGGRTEVRAHVAERSAVPRGRLAWAAAGVRAIVSREIEAGLTSPARGGERVTARWRFWPDRPAIGGAARFPLPGAGILAFDASFEEQAFDDESLPSAARVALRAGLSDWATGSFRWELRGGLERRDEGRRLAAIGGGARLRGGRAALEAVLDGWIGEGGFASVRAGGAWRSSAVPRGSVLALWAGFEAVSDTAPLDIWPAGDTGHARRPLLRAHPVLDGGRLRVGRLGRSLTHASVEGQRWWGGSWPVPLGAAIFADAARTADRASGRPLHDLDVGAGVRIALPAGAGTLRIDLARGLRDAGHAISVGLTP